MKDPLGKAIQTYHHSPSTKLEIIVHSKSMDDDVIPVHYLFRKYKDFPIVEKTAMKQCYGRILDVGAGAGAHSKYLQDKGFTVDAIDTSFGAVEYLKACGINVQCINIFDFEGEKYDTILLLMNGIGLAGKLSNVKPFLLKLKGLLNPNGQILVDSTDVRYLFTEEDGSQWMDLNSEYFGNFEFQMEFQQEKSDWFNWTYVDFDSLEYVSKTVGLDVELLVKNENNFLVKLINRNK